MRKFLLSLLFFVFACANAWGATITPTFTWSDNNTKVTISGTGAIRDYNTTTDYSPAFAKRTTLTTVVVAEGITHLGKYLFYSCSNITSVQLPSTLVSIAQQVFEPCTSMAEIHASTPNDWASIEFQGALPYKAHPFGTSTASKRKFFFNGSASETKNITFSSGLTQIKAYAFYNATEIESVSIPNSVTTIGDKAFYCNIKYNVAINRSTPPTTGTSSFTFNSSNATKLYIPTGATSNYSANPWYDAGGSNGAKSRVQQAVSGTMSNTIGEDVTWALGTDGTLTLNATGANKEISIIREANTSYEDYPWIYFRRLVNKVILRGEIEEVKESFTYCYGLNEIELDQTTIPTITTSGTHATIAFSSRFDQSKNVVLKIKSASLADASANNLGSAPWSNAKLDIQLSDNLVIGDNNANNSTVLANCSTYVEAPITLQLGRSLTNAQYNTFCSPVPMNASDISSKFGGADIRALISSSLDGDALTLNFSESSLSTIEAGVPYLIQPANNVDNITFTDVDPSSIVAAGETIETTYADFIGVLAPTALEEKDKNTLFLGADNELFWPAEGSGDIKGMRAYFSIKGDARKAAKRARIVMNKEVTTDIETVSDERLTISGKKILRDGQLFIIRDNKTYNAQGQLVK